MRCILAFFAVMFSITIVSAQDIEVKKFKQLEKDQKAVTNYRNDNNGEPCALLIVHSLKNDLEFEGWVVGSVERKDDAYWIFVANGAKHIKIKHSDYQTKDVVFGEYSVSTLKGGTTYDLQLMDGTKDIINKVYRLGWNLNGMEVPKNIQNVLRIAAIRGDVKAQKAMALLSLGGETHVDEFFGTNQGLYWIVKLLEQGDSTCLDSMPGKLMHLYADKLIFDGISTNGTPNYVDTEKERKVYTEACVYYLKACLKGYKIAGRDFFINYPESNGLAEFHNEILSLCMDSVSVGNDYAMTCLGHIFEEGICEQVNLKEAAIWFLKANEKNSTEESKTNLCRVYGNKSFPIDDESLDFIKKESEEGLKEALYQLGCMYEEGRNVPHNEEMAIDLFKQSISHDRHHGATYRLARIYYEQKKYTEAEKLLRILEKDELDSRYLNAIMLFHDERDIYSYKIDAFNILSNLSKNGYQKATDFIKDNY